MEILIHDCAERFKALNPEMQRRLRMPPPQIFMNESGSFYMDNLAYEISVAFCPFCGIDLSSIEPTMRSNFND